jgi:hypothetical protein
MAAWARSKFCFEANTAYDKIVLVESKFFEVYRGFGPVVGNESVLQAFRCASRRPALTDRIRKTAADFKGA